jgi:membrane-bound inhibitor of C-type lysozyme
MTIRPFVLLSLMMLAACQSSSSGGVADPDSVSQPRNAQFRCDNGQALQVESLGASVNVTKEDGSIVALPALPTGSRSRYSEGQTALVFDGRNALYMETGKQPLECKR